MPRPGTVTMDGVAYCAMVHAFLRHPAHVREWSHASGRLHVLFEIFGGTRSLSFKPDDETVAAYRAFATAELARLAASRKNARLMCRHSIASHTQALNGILGRLPKASTH